MRANSLAKKISLTSKLERMEKKDKACHLLDRCDSTLSKWAQRGILVPIRRDGQLYYRKSDVLEMYKGEL